MMAAAVAAANADEQSDEEKRWLCRVRETLEQLSAEQLGAAARVFDVPRSLRATKPEAYAPQHFALGPYHHGRPELRDMERYKLAAAKRAERFFAGGRGVAHLAQRFVEIGSEIRRPYHRVLELGHDTLAWMMAIDTCFLLDFLESYHRRGGEATPEDMVSSSANWINATVRDAMMIENQLPLRLFAEALKLRRTAAATDDDDEKQAAAATRDVLCPVIDHFIKHVSPIKLSRNAKVAIADFTEQAHLLELLYHFLVPPDAVFDDGKDDPAAFAQGQAQAGCNPDDLEEQLLDVAPELAGVQPPQRDESTVKKAVLQVFHRLNMGSLLGSRPMSSVSKLYEKMTRKLPALPGMVSVARNLAASVDVNAILNGMNTDGVAAAANAPLAKEIKVPSVSQLASCGVRFAPTPDGIHGIDFNAATATLLLPAITLDGNTEVVLRNLVAYEAVAVRGPLVLSRYTELMNGIIDTTRDVKILRRSGVVVNRMKSNREAAGMWNGMCRAARVSRVSRLDDVIRAVNEHRDRTPSVRARKMLKRYVFGSWKVLTLLASLVLLLMTALEAFCSAYPCQNSWFRNVLQLSSAGAAPTPE